MYLLPQPPPLSLFAFRLFPHAQEVQAAEGKEQAAACKEYKYREKKKRENQPPAPPRTECQHEMRGRKRRRTSVGVWRGRAPASVGGVETVKVSVKCLAVKCVNKSLCHSRREACEAARGASQQPCQNRANTRRDLPLLTHSCHSQQENRGSTAAVVAE